MTEENINAGAANSAGSPANSSNSGAANSAGSPGVNLADYVSKVDYEALATKLGENSSELGGLRKFFEEIHPLMEKLQDQPEVIEAIVSGKLDSKLAQAVMDGKVDLKDATQVAEVHAQVKDELGKDKYNKLSGDDIEKLVMRKIESSLTPIIEKLGKSEQNLNKALTESDERREFENKVNGFIKNTNDFQDYAADVDKWFDEHPDQFDVEVAYYAVKGRKTTTEAMKQAEVTAAEEAKRLAANAGGGSSQGGAVINDPDFVDRLFGKVRNPNS